MGICIYLLQSMSGRTSNLVLRWHSGAIWFALSILIGRDSAAAFKHTHIALLSTSEPIAIWSSSWEPLQHAALIVGASPVRNPLHGIIFITQSLQLTSAFAVGGFVSIRAKTTMVINHVEQTALCLAIEIFWREN